MSFPLRVVGITVLGIAAGMSLVARAQAPDSEKIHQLFHQMNSHAVEAEYDAELLASYTRCTVAPETHANRIQQIRLHINDLIEDYNTAKELRPLGSEWQKEAIDQVEPVLRQMADNLSVSIKYLLSHKQQTNMQPWVDYVKADEVFANKSAKLIHDYVDYGESRAKSDSLEQKLGTPGQG